MKDKRLRIFALSIVLVLPVFFFFLFRPLSKVPRPKSPPHLYPIGVIDTIDREGKHYSDTVYQKIPNYKFQTHNGDSLELDSMRGKIYVADFFFASCPGICPKLSGSMQKVQKDFIKDENFKLVSFSVDPDRDTVAALHAYAEEHDAVPGKWFFLRGSKQDIFKLAEEGFHITAKDDDGGGPEAFVHSEKIVLVDGEGVIRGFYSGVDSISVKKLEGDIALLITESSQGFSFKKQKQTTKKLF